jgi:hypothetical protein
MVAGGAGLELRSSGIGRPLAMALDVNPRTPGAVFSEMPSSFPSILLSGALLCACGPSPTEVLPELDPQDGMVEGIIDGSPFRGTGMFGGTTDVRMGFGGNFQFSSMGVGPSEGELLFGIWHDGVLPPPGSYSVDIPDVFQRGFWLFYSRESGGRTEHYAAYAGTIAIDSSSPGEVRGSFHVSAWLRCAVPPEPTCPDLTGEVTGTETIELSGSFRLVHAEIRFEPL